MGLLSKIFGTGVKKTAEEVANEAASKAMLAAMSQSGKAAANKVGSGIVEKGAETGLMAGVKSFLGMGAKTGKAVVGEVWEHPIRTAAVVGGARYAYNNIDNPEETGFSNTMSTNASELANTGSSVMQTLFTGNPKTGEEPFFGLGSLAGGGITFLLSFLAFGAEAPLLNLGLAAVGALAGQPIMNAITGGPSKAPQAPSNLPMLKPQRDLIAGQNQPEITRPVTPSVAAAQTQGQSTGESAAR